MLAPVLQMDVWLDPAYVCALYESCKGTNAVAQVIFYVVYLYVCACLHATPKTDHHQSIFPPPPTIINYYR